MGMCLLDTKQGAAQCVVSLDAPFVCRVDSLPDTLCAYIVVYGVLYLICNKSEVIFTL